MLAQFDAGLDHVRQRISVPYNGQCSAMKLEDIRFDIRMVIGMIAAFIVVRTGTLNCCSSYNWSG
jgi:hypothetical protein